MNELRLVATFEADPPEESKQMIEADVRSFLINYAPDAVFEVTSGPGSWWISVLGMSTGIVGWLSEQFASWTVKKSLDHIVEKYTKNEFPAQIDNMEIVHGRLASIAEKMNDLAIKFGSNSIIFGICDEKSRGLIFNLRRGSVDTRFDVYRTNSREDFHSLTTPGM